jgi:hypothetical protein
MSDLWFDPKLNSLDGLFLSRNGCKQRMILRAKCPKLAKINSVQARQAELPGQFAAASALFFSGCIAAKWY